jgi:hypothetical protein
MGDKEFIEETSSPSGEAELPAKLASDPPADVAKAASAGADAGTIETAAVTAAPKLAAAAETTTAPGQRAFASCDAADADDAVAERAEASSVSRFTLFAAAVALAAALGAMIGALTAYGLARPASTAVAADALGVEDIQALKENVVQEAQRRFRQPHRGGATHPDRRAHRTPRARPNRSGQARQNPRCAR